MNNSLNKILEELTDQNNILPYASAQGFCYINREYFHPRYLPHYKKHFFPFRNFRHHTFYQIGNMRPYLAAHLSDMFLKEGLNLEPNEPCVAISKIFVAGITERESDSLITSDNTEIQPLTQQYGVTLMDTEDARRVRVGLATFSAMGSEHANFLDKIFTEKDWKEYELDMEYPKNNILLFSLNIISV